MHDPRDPAEYDECSYEVDYAAYCDDRESLEVGATRLFPTEPMPSPYRVASERLMGVLNQLLTFLAAHGHDRTTTLWGVAYALGHPMTAGRSMRDTARWLGCTKQAISKIACKFLEQTGLPPSPALKSESAKRRYKLTNGNRRHGNPTTTPTRRNQG